MSMALSEKPWEQREPSVRLIAECAGMKFGASYAEIISPRRLPRILLPRQVACYLARKLTSYSLPDIGRRMGGRDHTTVLHACRTVEEKLASNATGLHEVIAEIEQTIACSVVAMEKSGRVVFCDVDAFAASRRVLEQDVCRVSIEEVRTMAGLIIGTVAPIIETSGAPPAEALPPAIDPHLSRAITQALDAWQAFTSAETGPHERYARQALEASMKSLRTTFEQEKS